MVSPSNHRPYHYLPSTQRSTKRSCKGDLIAHLCTFSVKRIIFFGTLYQALSTRKT